MSNVISMPRRDLNDTPTYVVSPRWNFDHTFFLGVILTVVAPQIIFGSYFGLAMLLLLAACTVIGTGIGISNYRRSPILMPSCAPPSVVRTSTHRDAKMRLAA